MQITIDLPDNLTEELLEKPDFKKFVQDGITKILLDYKIQQNSYTALKNEQTDTPITKSLVGVIRNCNLDESDYNKHLEEKYL
ncbi:hypothetical protein [Methylovulum psychrotolerans]|uniref:Uncharacterized protein n=1 Tax=Methylovulum psychrotolerans TaxID=1704499 RepID=A0A2S5CG55_9GAMM|nr:hypothetical protein [Methylovulum psychrotolerans]POZ49788.1 hypothetical protein AADEFJLK_04403 [Methylovulum psychrotolerans]